MTLPQPGFDLKIYYVSFAINTFLKLTYLRKGMHHGLIVKSLKCVKRRKSFENCINKLITTGEAKTLPATQPVVSYKTDVDDEYLYLEVGEDA